MLPPYGSAVRLTLVPEILSKLRLALSPRAVDLGIVNDYLSMLART